MAGLIFVAFDPHLSQYSSLCLALKCELSESDRFENTIGQEYEKGRGG